MHKIINYAKYAKNIKILYIFMHNCLLYFCDVAIICKQYEKREIFRIYDMKKSVKTIIVLAVVATIITACFALVACNDKDINLVAVNAADLIKEDFGIAVTKGNTALMDAINQVVDEWTANGKISQYTEYYSALADEENGGEKAVAPEGLQTSWDFKGATQTIAVYTESGFAPYEFVYGGNVVGIDIAIMSQVAVNTGKKIEVKDVAFDVIATNVSTATGDAVGAAGMSITDERKEVVDFSHVYAYSTLVVVSKDGQYKSVKDLAGKKVGVQEGTSGDIIISEAIGGGYTYEIVNGNEAATTVVVKAEGAEVKQYKAYALALQDLKNGRIDAILMDNIPAELMLK